jgi:NitT/TauT family transport system substrate-binding protein
VTKLNDLAGETLYISHKSGPPDVLTRYLLSKQNLLEQVTFHYATPPEIANLLIAGKIKHAVLPEPALSSVRLQLKDKLHEIVDFQNEWQKIHKQSLPQAGIIVNKQWAKENPDAVLAFTSAYADAISYIKEHPDETANIAEKALALKAPVIKSALNKMILDAVAAQDAKPAVEAYFQILYEFDANTIGGKLPDATFYFVQP